ncbi:D-alanyl-D-alanine carboxypeptidase family protein [Streptomyces sp. NPDC059096]|uniref:D-alanyl-D-alanine carboxypeptidase family protein n=1 Tax=Streptomyces sp. NPDC059096 TaxID=3346727 RepID=UPI0036D15B5D
MPALKKTAVTVLAAALLPVIAALPAVAATAAPGTPEAPTASADSAADAPDKKQPKPPASMSTVGGTLLGKAGTQVHLGAGVPVLPKKLSGRSWIVADAESGDILASHNAHWRLPPASTLKMLFADTLLPKLPATEQYKVTNADLTGVGAGSSLVGVKENLTYSVHDLWLGVFLRSGNDAVHVLSAMNGGVEKTVGEMQAQADELQALDTHVVTPDGYDEKGQVSSAYDLTLIARSGLQKKEFREYSSTQSAKFPGEFSKPKEGEKKEGFKPVRENFEIQNTNRLLTGANGVAQYRGIAGVKNGSTTHAGNTFTGVAERDGKKLLVTVMNPSSTEAHAVYQETARLLDWGFAASGKVKPVGVLVPPKSARTSPSPEPTQVGADTGGGHASTVAAANSGTGGAGVALGITGGALVLLAGTGYLVNRRWPLPDLVRRRPRG